MKTGTKYKSMNRVYLNQGVKYIINALCICIPLMLTMFAILIFPYWFKYSFAYSGLVGRTDGRIALTRDTLACQADVAFITASVFLFLSISIRVVQHMMMQPQRYVFCIGKAVGEIILLCLVCYVLSHIVTVPEGLHKWIIGIMGEYCK